MSALIREFINFSTFSSVWYWIFLALAWSSRTHWTLGAPFDAVVRAEKRGGRWQTDLEAIVHANSARFSLFAGRGGPWVVAFGTFFLTGLITASLVTPNEMVRGLTAVAVPMAIAEIGDVRLALRIHATDIRGYALRRALVWRRFMNQVTGLASLFVAASLAGLAMLKAHGFAPW